MKTTLICLLALLTFTFSTISAQELKGKIPAASTGQRSEQDFGLGTISVKYYRPNTKGRKIFGGIEPYGIVWRTGANNNTVITLTDTVQFEGNTVNPGSYSLFSIPGADQWTIILSKNTGQWGAYTYNEKDDLLRFKVKPVKLADKVETLTIGFADIKEATGLMQIQWENTAINIHLKTNNLDDRIMANIKEAMKGEQKPYFAAIWYYNHNKDLNQALSWMQEADKAQPNSFAMKYWIARIQLKRGDKAAAIASGKEGLRIATEQKNSEYIRLNTEVLKDAGVN
jgi:hypothetical protein